jgi:hypothetical protein
MQRTDSTEHAKGSLLYHGRKGLREVYALALPTPVDYQPGLVTHHLPKVLLFLEDEEAAQYGSAPRWAASPAGTARDDQLATQQFVHRACGSKAINVSKSLPPARTAEFIEW